MQTKILRKEENLLEFEVIGENHTFLSMLREALKDQSGVLFAAYRMPHPILENPIVYLKTEGTDPLVALHHAADAIIQKCDDLLKVFEAQVSEP